MGVSMNVSDLAAALARLSDDQKRAILGAVSLRNGGEPKPELHPVLPDPTLARE